VFMAGHQTTPTTVTNKKDQARIWKIAAERGFPVLAHAEDQSLVTKQEQALQRSGRTDMFAYSQARNEAVVIKAAKIAVELAVKYKTKLWILHASTQGEFEEIRKARLKGINVGGEVAGYQLFLQLMIMRNWARLSKSPPQSAPSRQMRSCGRWFEKV